MPSNTRSILLYHRESVSKINVRLKIDIVTILSSASTKNRKESSVISAIYMDVVVENCSYIFDTSAIGQEPRCREAHGGARAAIAQGMCRCREAHGSARATIHGGRIQVLHGAKTCPSLSVLIYN